MSYMSEWKNYYRLSAGDLSQSSIRTLRGSASIGLVAVILALLMLWGAIPTNLVTGLSLTGGLAIGLIALSHRLPNFLAITDKHLDEWDIVAKKNAESFTYRVIFWTTLGLMMIGLMLSGGDAEDLRLVLTPSLWQIGFTLILLPFLLQFITTNHIAWSVKPISKEELVEAYEASKGEIEPRRKFGKKSVLLFWLVIGLSIVGGDLIDRKYETLAHEDAETCVVNMETEVPLAQLKNLHDCKSLEVKAK